MEAHAQASRGCRPADSVKVPAHLAYLKSLVVDTDSVAVPRARHFSLQATTATKVSLVTKNSTCTSAAAALNAIAGTPGTVRQVWVYTLGSNHAVGIQPSPWSRSATTRFSSSIGTGIRNLS